MIGALLLIFTVFHPGLQVLHAPSAEALCCMGGKNVTSLVRYLCPLPYHLPSSHISLTVAVALFSTPLNENISLISICTRRAAFSLFCFFVAVYLAKPKTPNTQKRHRFVASAGMGRQVVFWNPYTMHILARGEGHASSVRHCLIDDRNGRVITVSADKAVRCWDSATLRCIQVKGLG